MLSLFRFRGAVQSATGKTSSRASSEDEELSNGEHLPNPLLPWAGEV